MHMLCSLLFSPCSRALFHAFVYSISSLIYLFTTEAYLPSKNVIYASECSVDISIGQTQYRQL